MVQWNDSISREMKEVESTLTAVVDSGNDELKGMCMHVLTAHGKMIRPAMCILSYYVGGGKNAQRAVEVGSAFEIVHSATLIHDDINDKSEIRRGRRALHKEYTVTKAILVGDYLLVKGFYLLGTSSEEVIRIITETATGMSESELIQKSFEHKVSVSEDDYYRIVRGKTAMLISASAKAGASLAGASFMTKKALGEYAINLGMAFQIVDDLLDVIGNEEQTGKDVGSDLLESKPTLPMIFAMADPTYGKAMKKLFMKRKVTSDDVARGIELIKKTDAVDRCMEKAKHFADLAKASLNCITDSVYKQSMLMLADYIVCRDR